ncbi:MAG: alpha/beta hydrolase [Dokdonella sp.]
MLAHSASATFIEPRCHRQRMRDGVELHIEETGRDGAQPIVFCHGFGQTRAAWRGSARALGEAGYRCLTVDMRGHGDSDWLDSVAYDLDQFRDDLLDIVARLDRKPVLVGASMGGLTGLIAEGEHKGDSIFKALVLVDVTPRWEAAGVERIIDFMRSNPDGFASVEDAAAAISSYLPHRRREKSPDRLKSLLVRRADGRLRWHWDPALLDVVSGDVERYQPRLVAATKAITTPILLVSGGASDVVSTATINDFLQLAPHAQHVSVPKATHMVAGDDNAAFTNQVRDFIAGLAA